VIREGNCLTVRINTHNNNFATVTTSEVTP